MNCPRCASPVWATESTDDGFCIPCAYILWPCETCGTPVELTYQPKHGALCPACAEVGALAGMGRVLDWTYDALARPDSENQQEIPCTRSSRPAD